MNKKTKIMNEKKNVHRISLMIWFEFLNMLFELLMIFCVLLTCNEKTLMLYSQKYIFGIKKKKINKNCWRWKKIVSYLKDVDKNEEGVDDQTKRNEKRKKMKISFEKLFKFFLFFWINAHKTIFHNNFHALTIFIISFPDGINEHSWYND